MVRGATGVVPTLVTNVMADWMVETTRSTRRYIETKRFVSPTMTKYNNNNNHAGASQIVTICTRASHNRDDNKRWINAWDAAQGIALFHGQRYSVKRQANVAEMLRQRRANRTHSVPMFHFNEKGS